MEANGLLHCLCKKRYFAVITDRTLRQAALDRPFAASIIDDKAPGFEASTAAADGVLRRGMRLKPGDEVPVPDPTRDGRYCKAWWHEYTRSTAVLALIPLSIAAFNGVGKFVLDKMAVVERYWQIGDQMYSAALKMSLLTVVNTGFVILAVDWH